MKDPHKTKNDKKLRFDTAKIRSTTLLFENKALEERWDMDIGHKARLKSMTVRYLFASGLFQAMFLWSDVIESKNDPVMTEGLFLKAMIRLGLGVTPLILCFIIAVGLVSPSQLTVMGANLLYGIPTLVIYIMSRRTHCHWDSLFLIYGLAFFMLPKLSPLNFVYGVSGSLFLVLIYVYMSSFRLSFQEWLLSNSLLGAIFVLMAYLSYSSEKASRERWLLKERLQKEKISVKLVASSIQDDLRRAAHEERLRSSQRMAELGSMTAEVKSVATNLAWRASFMSRLRDVSSVTDDQADGGGGDTALVSSRGGVSAPGSPDRDEKSGHGDSISASATSDRQKKIDLKKNLALFFKGLAGWGIIVLFSYTFDALSRDPNSDSSRGGEANTSVAFALLMHTSGFSVFLLYFTGQIRWLMINGIVGLTLMWMLNLSGMDQKWVVFGTHTAGYMILVVVVVVMSLVFGGVVLVWTNLIDFLKDVLVRYPQVKNELSENKLLEQVVVTYISQLPQDNHAKRELSTGAEGQNVSLHVTRGGTDEESGSTSLIRTVGKGGGGSGGRDSTNKKGGNCKNGKSVAVMETQQHHQSFIPSDAVLVSAMGRSSCYFCLKNESHLCYVPVCRAWKKEQQHGAKSELHSVDSSGPSSPSSPSSSSSHLSCTSFADMSVSRQGALLESKQVTADWLQLSEAVEQLRGERHADKRSFEASLRQAALKAEELEKQLLSHQAGVVLAKKKAKQALDEAERKHEVMVRELKGVCDRDVEVLRGKIIACTRSLEESRDLVEAQSRQLDSQTQELILLKQQQQHQSQSQSQSHPVTGMSQQQLNKNGIDITNRNARRNANNPNNPAYNPNHRVGNKKGSSSSSGSGSGSKSKSKKADNVNEGVGEAFPSGTADSYGVSALYPGSRYLDMDIDLANLPPPHSGPDLNYDDDYDATGGGEYSSFRSHSLSFNSIFQNSGTGADDTIGVRNKSNNNNAGGTVPVYTGSLSLPMPYDLDCKGGIGSVMNDNDNDDGEITPLHERAVISHVIDSLALDDTDG
jgi:hypothetical protein